VEHVNQVFEGIERVGRGFANLVLFCAEDGCEVVRHGGRDFGLGW
jgi:hypothetical protein